jgi:hypothetical protein
VTCNNLGHALQLLGGLVDLLEILLLCDFEWNLDVSDEALEVFCLSERYKNDVVFGECSF